MAKNKTDKARVIINGEGWPLKREGKTVPLFRRADHIGKLYDVIGSKRVGVEAE